MVNANMTKTNERITCTIMIAQVEAGGLLFIATDEEGHSYSVKLTTDGYDEQQFKYVPSEEVREGANKILEEFGLSLETPIDEFIGKEIKVYDNGERTSFKEIKSFPKVTPIEGILGDELNDDPKQLIGCELLPVTDFEGLRFNFLAQYNKNGKTYNLKISRILYVDENGGSNNAISTKYQTKLIETLRNKFEDSNLTDVQKDALENSYNSQVERERTKKINELSTKLSDLFPEGFETYLNSEEQDKLVISKAKVSEINTKDGVKYYLSASLERK